MLQTIDLNAYFATAEEHRQAKELRALLEQCAQQGLLVSLVGGYGLDALYGRLTRAHRDFDLLVEAGSREAFLALLQQRGYARLPEAAEPKLRREVYRQADTGYLVDWLVLDAPTLAYLAQRNGFSADLSLFLPPGCVGQLLGLPVRVPTVVGIEIIDQVIENTSTHKLAADFTHIRHRASLLNSLKKQYCGY